MRYRWFAIVACFWPFLANAQDQCKDVVSIGQNLEIAQTNEYAKEVVGVRLYQMGYSEAKKTLEAHGGITIKGIPLSGGMSEDRYDQFRQIMEQTTNIDKVQANSSSILQITADGKAIEAWSKCMHDRRGIFMWLESNGEPAKGALQINIVLRYFKSVGGPSGFRMSSISLNPIVTVTGGREFLPTQHGGKGRAIYDGDEVRLTLAVPANSVGEHDSVSVTANFVPNWKPGQGNDGTDSAQTFIPAIKYYPAPPPTLRRLSQYGDILTRTAGVTQVDSQMGFGYYKIDGESGQPIHSTVEHGVIVSPSPQQPAPVFAIRLNKKFREFRALGGLYHNHPSPCGDSKYNVDFQILIDGSVKTDFRAAGSAVTKLELPIQGADVMTIKAIAREGYICAAGVIGNAYLVE